MQIFRGFNEVMRRKGTNNKNMEEKQIFLPDITGDCRRDELKNPNPPPKSLLVFQRRAFLKNRVVITPVATL